jgi:hypothetical protein
MKYSDIKLRSHSFINNLQFTSTSSWCLIMAETCIVNGNKILSKSQLKVMTLFTNLLIYTSQKDVLLQNYMHHYTVFLTPYEG